MKHDHSNYYPASGKQRSGPAVSPGAPTPGPTFGMAGRSGQKGRPAGANARGGGRLERSGARGRFGGGTPRHDGRIAPELMGLFCILLAALLFISLASHNPADPSLNHLVRGAAGVKNLAGMFGAYISAFLLDLFGFAAYVPFLFLCVAGARLCVRMAPWPWWRWLSFVLLLGCVCAASSFWGLGLGDARSGGLLGGVLRGFSVRYLNAVGSAVVWSFAFLLVLQMLFGFSWRQLAFRGVQALREHLAEAAGAAPEAADERAGVPEAGRAPALADEPAGRGAVNRSGGPASLSIPLGIGVDYDKAADNGVAAGMSGLAGLGGLFKGDFFTRLRGAGGRKPEADAPPGEDGNFLEPSAVAMLMGRDDSAVRQILAENPAGTPEELAEQPFWLTDLESGRIGVPQAARSRAPTELERTGQDAVSNSAVFDLPGSEEGSVITDDVVVEEIYKETARQAPKPRRIRAKLPPMSLLRPVGDGAQTVSRDELEEKGRALMTCFRDFSIQAQLVRISPGPVVTSFEVRPAPGVKSARISSLSDDLALSLKAVSVRVQAPIPGTDTVGIEIPNDRREVVGLRDLLGSPAFQDSDQSLAMALGKDISGAPTISDLSRMPHMLVAGATGTGKSVFLNSVLLSFLYKCRPDELKLLLVDPKRIEMAVYADLPHLVHPIVTEMSLAKNALDWAVAEMERRYGDIARLGVRNVASYNQKLKEMGDGRPDNLCDLEPMPYLVIIIDELADLMLTAGKEVETSIVRLAQLARAAGIHLIIATQRPSVDVVTGLIKANFPCRISFQVTSKHDSRTILDTVGAEHLLGRGDMLFKPAGGRQQRLHGAFVPDDDVAAVADYWRKQQPPEYQVDFEDWAQENASGGAAGGQSGGDDISKDQVYNEAVEFVRQQGKASISLIQRRFRIGFNRAARYIEQMEQDGIIGPPDGSKPRAVR